METALQLAQQVRAAVEEMRTGKVSWSVFRAQHGDAVERFESLIQTRITELEAPVPSVPGFAEEVAAMRTARVQTLQAVAQTWKNALNPLIAAEPNSAEIDAALEGLRNSEQALTIFAAQLRGEARLPLSALQLGGDFLAVLVDKLAQNKIDRDAYMALLASYARETDELIDLGRKNFFAAIELLRESQTDETKLRQAALLLAQAWQAFLGAAANTQLRRE